MSSPGLLHRPLPVSILTALLALVALAGCGGRSNPQHAVRSAATNTLSLTAQSTLKLTGAQLFGGTPGTIVGRGEFSFPKGLGYGALQVPALGQRAGGTSYLVYLPKQLWSKPIVNTALPDGHLWISAKFADSRSAGSTTPSLALVLESMNPQLLLEEIATGAVAASSSGHRVIDHVPLTEYVVSVIWRGQSRRARPDLFAPRCNKNWPRSAPVEARAGAQWCGSWRGSTEQSALLNCKPSYQARSWALFNSRSGSSGAQSH